MSEWVWMDGRIVPATEAMVPVSDRSFLYGDGLFESLPWDSGRLFRWRAHWDRLKAGAAFLNIRIQPLSSPHSGGCHESCTDLKTRSGCGIMIVTRPSAEQKPATPSGEPFGFAGYAAAGCPWLST